MLSVFAEQAGKKILNMIILNVKWTVKPTAGQGCKLGWLFSGPLGNMFPPLKRLFLCSSTGEPEYVLNKKRVPNYPLNS